MIFKHVLMPMFKDNLEKVLQHILFGKINLELELKYLVII